MATATAAAEQSQSGAKRRIALAAFALLALAAAAAAIIGTHGSSWGKTAIEAPDASHVQHSDSFEVKSILDALNKGAVTDSGFDEAAAVNNVADVASNLNDITFNSEANKAASTLVPGGGPFNNGMGGVAQTAGAVSVGILAPAAGIQASGERCIASTFDELKEAVEEKTCPTVLLQGAGKYEVEEEIIVRRRVSIIGNPSLMPTLDGQEAARSFRVMPGAYLDVRFVQFIMSEGVYRDPLPWEFATSPRILEVRGGSVLFEPGAIGGIFTGCFFIDDPDQEASLATAIQQTMDQVTIRFYGGHIFAAGGDLEFHGCLFWDLTILLPFTNLWYIGSDVLHLGGTSYYNGCTWLENNIIINENGIGLFVAQFGGISRWVFNTFVENNMAVTNNGMGTFYFIGGGVMSMTLSVINEFSGVLSLSGLGGVTVLGGVFIETGVSNVEAFPVGSVFGIGFEYAIGSGVVVTTGSSMNEFNCLYFYASLGEVMFVGSGLVIGTGSPFLEYVSILSENVQGGSVYLGAGYASFVGCPFSEWLSIGFVAGAGEYVAVDAGFLVWIASVIIEGAVIEFSRILGSVLYVGAGAAVIIATPLVEFYGPIVTRVSEFWVMGTCEFEGGAPDLTGGGGGGGETEGTRALSLAYGASVRRQMYNLPRWVAPLNGCQKDVDFFFGKAGGAAGISVGGETEGSRRSLASAKAIVRAAQAKRGGDKKALAARRPAVDRKLLSFFKKGGSTAHLPDQVRRSATNYWHGSHYDQRRMLKRQARGLPHKPRNLGAQAQAQPQGGLLGMGVTRNEFDRAKAQKHMPTAWIDSFETTRTELGLALGLDPAAKKEAPPAFYIESDVGGYCGLCQVPSVNGTGMGSCEVQDDCRALNLPNGSQRYAAKAETADEDDVHFDDHHVLVLSLEATSVEALASLEAAEVQEAAVAAIAELQGPDPDREAIVVNVYQGGPDPYFADMFPAPKRSLQETNVYTRTHLLQVAIVAATKPAMDLVRAALERDENGFMGESPLATGIRTALLAQGTELGYVGLEEDKYFVIPAYDSPEHTQTRRRSLAAHSAVLVDPSQPAVPVEHVEYGKTYKLHLENFPASAALKVDLVKFHDEEDRKAGRHLLHAVAPNVTTNEEGHAELDVVFTQHVAAGTDYYFSVQTTEGGDGEAAYGVSQGYTITAEPVARRLYGPSRVI